MSYRLAFFAVLIILLFSCSGPTDVEETGQDLKLVSAEAGSVIKPGEQIPLTLRYNQSAFLFDYLKLIIKDESGTVLSEQDFDKSQLPDNYKNLITFPDAKEGIYTLEFQLFYQSKITFSEKINIFLTSGEYKLNSIQSFPPNPLPGENVLLVANYSAPDFADPFFKWTIGKSSVLEGSLSEGANSYSWYAPTIEGAYPVNVELFPYAPESGKAGKLISAISSNTTVIVSKSNNARIDELGPPDSYSILYHLRGNFENSGYQHIDIKDIKIYGNPLPSFKGNFYGYSFGRKDYIELPVNAIPFSPGGIMQPFSLKIKFIPETSSSLYQAAEYSMFYCESENTDFTLAIDYLENNELLCEVKSGSNKFKGKTVYNNISGDSLIDMTVSFYPGKDNCTVLWIINGEILNREIIPFVPKISGNSVKTIFGGGPSSLLIDEIGVYARAQSGKNSPDPDAIKNYYSEKYGSSLIFAEGFHSVSAVEKRYNNKVDNGVLTLDSFKEKVCVAEKINLAGDVEIIVTGNCFMEIKNHAGEIYFAKQIKTGSENILLDNIPSGKYDINLSAPKEKQSGYAEKIIIARTH